VAAASILLVGPSVLILNFKVKLFGLIVRPSPSEMGCLPAVVRHDVGPDPTSTRTSLFMNNLRLLSRTMVS
jgi:hypothetical protein